MHRVENEAENNAWTGSVRLKAGLTTATLTLTLLITAACQDVQTSKKSGFKGKYQVARNALEEGSYARASRNYKSLLNTGGPLTPRLRLEYAHSLLRDDQFEAAAKQARIISQTQKGDARLAALAVQGTADHEIARAAMAQGVRDNAVRSRLNSARSAFDAVLKKAKVFDPLGSLAARRKLIDQELAQL